VTPSIDVEAALSLILKRYDRIGFGRRGVLDGEQEIRQFAAGLASDEHARFCRTVLTWLESDGAEQVAAGLHCNLPEHIQALAIRLCSSVPIPAGVDVLRALQRAGAFDSDDAQPCREALREAAVRLGQEI